MATLLAGALMRRVNFDDLWISILIPTLLILWVWFPIKSLRHPRSVWKYYKEELTEIREIRRFYFALLVILGTILGIFAI